MPTRNVRSARRKEWQARPNDSNSRFTDRLIHEALDPSFLFLSHGLWERQRLRIAYQAANLSQVKFPFAGEDF
jgi:hypothetical protein